MYHLCAKTVCVPRSSLSSRSPSMTTCTTMGEDEDEERQAALSDLITHLEDTAALLREHLVPPKPESGIEDIISYEQTTFLLKYQIVLVLFTQVRLMEMGIWELSLTL